MQIAEDLRQRYVHVIASVVDSQEDDALTPSQGAELLSRLEGMEKDVRVLRVLIKYVVPVHRSA